MIKSAIIFVLLVLLAGGAFLSRPTKQSFEAYVREQQKLSDTNYISKVVGEWRVDGYLSSIEFKDRYLWVEVAQEGKTQFIGAFSKFFSVAATESKAAADAAGQKAVAEPKPAEAAPEAKKPTGKTSFSGGD